MDFLPNQRTERACDSDVGVAPARLLVLNFRCSGVPRQVARRWWPQIRAFGAWLALLGSSPLSAPCRSWAMAQREKVPCIATLYWSCPNHLLGANLPESWHHAQSPRVVLLAMPRVHVLSIPRPFAVLQRPQRGCAAERRHNSEASTFAADFGQEFHSPSQDAEDCCCAQCYPKFCDYFSIQCRFLDSDFSGQLLCRHWSFWIFERDERDFERDSG